MSLLGKKKPTSAGVAVDRLRIVLQHERAGAGPPDFLPMLSRELRDLIERHVHCSPDDVLISIDQVDGQEVLEMMVRLRQGAHAPSL